MDAHPSPDAHTHRETLKGIEARVWAELSLAANDRLHPWRWATLATIGTDGQADARLVVVREADAELRELIFFTDARSPKVAQLAQHPLGTLVMWSATLGWQLRLKVLLSVETCGLAVSSRWATLKLTPAAQDYLSPLAPGSVIEQPEPERSSREYFAVVTAQVQAIDWLSLDRDSPRRARFAHGHRSCWLQP